MAAYDRTAVDTVPNPPQELFRDEFSRTVASGIGSAAYADSWQGGQASVDGSQLVVPADGDSEWQWPGAPTRAEGVYQFDFWVPANTSDQDYWYEVDGPREVINGVGRATSLIASWSSGSTWRVSAQYYSLGPSFSLLTTTFTPTPSTFYTAKLELDTLLGRLRVKVWKRGDAEPDWAASTTSLGSWPAGWSPFFYIVSGAEGAKFDNLIVTEVEHVRPNDQLASVHGLLRDASDSTPVPTDTAEETPGATAGDTTSTSDSLARSKGARRTIVHSGARSELITRRKHAFRDASDPVATNELAGAVVNVIFRDAADTLAVPTDTVTRLPGRVRKPTDTRSTTEAVSRAAGYQRGAADATSVAEAVGQHFYRSADDSVTTSDAVATSPFAVRYSYPTDSVAYSRLSPTDRVEDDFSGSLAGWSSDSGDAAIVDGAVEVGPGTWDYLHSLSPAVSQPTRMQFRFWVPPSWPSTGYVLEYEVINRGLWLLIDLSDNVWTVWEPGIPSIEIPPPEPGRWYWAAYETDGQVVGDEYRIKLWPADEIEPDWQIVGIRASTRFSVQGVSVYLDADGSTSPVRMADLLVAASTLPEQDSVTAEVGEFGAAVPRSVSDAVTTSDSIDATVVHDSVHERSVADAAPLFDFVQARLSRASDLVVDAADPIFQTSVAADAPSGSTTIEVVSPGFNTVPFDATIDGTTYSVVSVNGTTWTLSAPVSGAISAGAPVTYGFSTGAGGQPRPIMTAITINNVDFTRFVDFSRSSWRTYGNGVPGTCEVWLKDVAGALAVPAGGELVVRYRGIRMWGGYVMSVKRSYAFSAGTGRPSEPRYLTLEGVDYNIFFQRRVFFDPADPTNMIVKHWPNGTFDSSVIGEVMTRFLDLSADGLSADIHHVGTPAIPTVSCNPDAPDEFGVGSAGWTWGDVMQSITSQTGAVYYIDPDKVLRYVDDATAQSAFGYTGISDAPSGGKVGYRELELSFDGAALVNEQYTWGIGQGAKAPVLGHVTDAPSIAEHKLWQSAEVRYDMYCQDSVDLRADTWVNGSPQNRRGGKDDRLVVRCTLFVPFFRVADVISVDVTAHGFSATMPVRGIELSFPTPWDIRCVLTASHEIDAPWNTYEFLFPDFRSDLPQLPNLNVDLPQIGLPAFDPCDPTCEGVDDTNGVPIAGKIDTFSRVVNSGLGVSEFAIGGTYIPSVAPSFAVDGFEMIMKRTPAFGGASVTQTIQDFPLVAPGCVRFDILWLDKAGPQFTSGAALIIRNGNRTTLSAFYKAYGLSIGWYPGGIINGQLNAFGGTFDDHGRAAPFSFDGFLQNVWYTWEMHFSNEGVGLIAYPTGDRANPLVDFTMANGPEGSGNDWYVPATTQLEWINSNSQWTDGSGNVTYGVVGDPVCYIDNLHVACDEGCAGYEPQTLGEAGSGGRFNETFLTLATDGWGSGWLVGHDGPSGRFFDRANVSLGPGRVGRLTSYIWETTATSRTMSGGSVVHLGPFDAEGEHCVLVRFSVPEVGPIGNGYMVFRVRLAGAPITPDDPGDENLYLGNQVNMPVDSVEPNVEYYLRATLTADGFLSGKRWKVSEDESVAVPLGVQFSSPDTVNPRIINLALSQSANTPPDGPEPRTVNVTLVRTECSDGGGTGGFPCGDPGEQADPSMDGSAQEQLECRYVDVDGNAVFATKYQFQPNSTEVWMDGVRLRLGIDYDEDWRNRHVLIHPELGITDCVGAPAITAAYRIWTVERPELIEGA